MRRRGVVVLLAITVVLAGRPGMPGAVAAAQPADARVVWPVRGGVVRAFDPPATRFGAGHRGIDLHAAPGERVAAAMAGTVTFAGPVAGTGWVTVRHGPGLDTTYGGVEPRTVSAGDRVDAGQTLGYLAEQATHLDWGARRHGAYLDPLALFGRWRVRLAPIERPTPAGASGDARARPLRPPKAGHSGRTPVRRRVSSARPGRRLHRLAPRSGSGPADGSVDRTRIHSTHREACGPRTPTTAGERPSSRC